MQAVIGILVMAILASGCATSGGDTTSRRVNNDLAGQETVPEANAKTLYAMSRLLMGQGKEPEAELVLLKVLAVHPQFALARADLAELYMGQGRIEEAAEQLDQALEAVPHDPVLLNNAGVCALFLGQYEKALERFRAAAEVVPHESRYSANQALALGLMGNYDASRQTYLQVLPAREAEHNLGVIREMRAARGLEPVEPATLTAPLAEVTSTDILSMWSTEGDETVAEVPAAPEQCQESPVRLSEEVPSAVLPAEQVVLAPVAPETVPTQPAVVTVTPEAPLPAEIASENPAETAKVIEVPAPPAEVVAAQETIEAPAPTPAVLPLVETAPLPGIRVLLKQPEAAEKPATPEAAPVQKREPGSVMRTGAPIRAIAEPPAVTLEDALGQRTITSGDPESAQADSSLADRYEIVDADNVE
jgi:Tfp pilus assembly protein PilF